MHYTRSTLGWATGLSLLTSSLAAAIGESIVVEPDVHHGFADIPEWLKEAVPLRKAISSNELEKRQQPGADCYPDDFLSAVQEDPRATPFCSTFIGIPAMTAFETITETSYVLNRLLVIRLN